MKLSSEEIDALKQARALIAAGVVMYVCNGLPYNLAGHTVRRQIMHAIHPHRSVTTWLETEHNIRLSGEPARLYRLAWIDDMINNGI
jgi:hypothetical protein